MWAPGSTPGTRSSAGRRRRARTARPATNPPALAVEGGEGGPPRDGRRRRSGPRAAAAADRDRLHHLAAGQAPERHREGMVAAGTAARAGRHVAPPSRGTSTALGRKPRVRSIALAGAAAAQDRGLPGTASAKGWPPPKAQSRCFVTTLAEMVDLLIQENRQLKRAMARAEKTQGAGFWGRP